MTSFVNEKLNVDSPEKVKDTITPQVGGSANIKLAESVERARQFNNQLELSKNPILLDKLSKISIKPVTNFKLAAIEQILKDKGMDSQQRLQAMGLIQEVLESD